MYLCALKFWNTIATDHISFCYGSWLIVMVYMQPLLPLYIRVQPPNDLPHYNRICPTIMVVGSIWLLIIVKKSWIISPINADRVWYQKSLRTSLFYILNGIAEASCCWLTVTCIHWQITNFYVQALLFICFYDVVSETCSHKNKINESIGNSWLMINNVTVNNFKWCRSCWKASSS